MLNFYDTKVLLNVRMDCEEIEYWYTEAPFANDPETVAGFLHEAKITHLPNPVPMSKIRMSNTRVAFTIEQLYGFTHDWYKQCDIKRFLPNWRFEDWYKNYLVSVLSIIQAHKQNFKLLSAHNMFSYHEALAEGILIDKIKSIKSIKEEHFVKFDGKTELVPELSWMVEDFLACRLKGTSSKYSGKLEKIIIANLRNLEYYCSIFSVIGNFKADVSLEKLTLNNRDDKIDMDSEQLESYLVVPEKGILLFQTPFVFHDCNTNYEHILRCLRAYRSERSV